MDAAPNSTSTVVGVGGVEVLVSILRDPGFIDMAEGAITCLERLSLDFPSAIARANGLTAVVNLIDFFSMHVQVKCARMAANACRGLISASVSGSDDGAAVFEMVKEVLPTLQRLMSMAEHSDTRLIDHCSKCGLRCIEWLARYEDRLQSIVGENGDLVKSIINNMLKPAAVLSQANIATTSTEANTSSSEEPTTPAASTPAPTNLNVGVFTTLIKVLVAIVRVSPSLRIKVAAEWIALGSMRTCFPSIIESSQLLTVYTTWNTTSKRNVIRRSCSVYQPENRYDYECERVVSNAFIYKNATGNRDL